VRPSLSDGCRMVGQRCTWAPYRLAVRIPPHHLDTCFRDCRFSPCRRSRGPRGRCPRRTRAGTSPAATATPRRHPFCARPFVMSLPFIDSLFRGYDGIESASSPTAPIAGQKRPMLQGVRDRHCHDGLRLPVIQALRNQPVPCQRFAAEGRIGSEHCPDAGLRRRRLVLDDQQLGGACSLPAAQSRPNLMRIELEHGGVCRSVSGASVPSVSIDRGQPQSEKNIRPQMALSRADIPTRRRMTTDYSDGTDRRPTSLALSARSVPSVVGNGPHIPLRHVNNTNVSRRGGRR